MRLDFPNLRAVDSLPSTRNLSRAKAPRFSKALAAALAGEGDVKIAVLGNSIAYGRGAGTGSVQTAGSWPRSWPVQFGRALSKLIDLPVRFSSFFGDGVDSDGLGTQVTELADTRFAKGAGWFAGNNTLGGRLFSNNTNANQLAFTPTESWNKGTIYVPSRSGSPFGVMAYQIDSGTVSTYDQAQGAGSTAAIALNAGSVGQHTVKVYKNVAGDGVPINIVGLDLYDDTKPSIRLWRWAARGWSWSEFADTSQPWRAINAIPSLGAHLVLMGEVANAFRNGGDNLSIATWQANARALANAVRSGGGDVAFYVESPLDDATAGSVSWSAARALTYAMAAEYDAPVIDFSDFLTDWPTMTAQGLISTANDGLHPNQYAYAAMGSLAARAVHRLV